MISKQIFGTLNDGTTVHIYTMRNAGGMSVSVTDFGGAVMEIRVPDKFGRMTDVVAGYDSLRDYVQAGGYLGALVGRCCNRIGNAKFTLNGKEYKLNRNDGPNCLHGGTVGFSHRVWSATTEDMGEPKLILTLVSKDGEENFPGTLCVEVTYTLRSDNALSIEYKATTDEDTVVNLTNHTYFNLGGYASGKIFDHVMQMDADTFLPTDEKLIPTGEIRKVAGTPFDFRSPKAIGKDFDTENNADMKLAGGYDHCLNFIGGETKEAVRRVMVYEPISGRMMEVYTNMPSIQFYTGNFLGDAEHPLKGGCPQTKQGAFCLETQKMPDAIHHPNFTDTVLHSGEVYDYTTIYKFSVK